MTTRTMKTMKVERRVGGAAVGWSGGGSGVAELQWGVEWGSVGRESDLRN